MQSLIGSVCTITSATSGRARRSRSSTSLAQRVSVGERRGRVEAERDERDDAFLRPEQPQLAQRATGSALGRGLDLGCLDELAGSHLGERLEVGLHRGDLGDGVDDRPLDLLGDLVGLVERQVAGQLQVERELDVTSERDDAEVVDLAHPRDATSRLRARGRAAPPRRLPARRGRRRRCPGSASSSSASTRSATAWP